MGLFDLLKQIVNDLDAQSVMSLLSAFLTIVAGSYGIYSQWRLRYARHRDKNAAGADQLDIQVELIQDYLRNQEQKETANKWVNYGFNAAQYVVGAALTTSLVSDNLSPALLGVLGVVTLLSSFGQQQFRPDIKRIAAGRRVVALKEILRRAEISATEAQMKNDAHFTLALAKGYVDELHKVQRDEWLERRRDSKDF